MATSDHGLARLDLAGNRIEWLTSDINHNKILLEGYHFHHVVPTATLALLCLCLLAFIAILMSLCIVHCGRSHASDYLPWKSVWVGVLCMTGYFGSDMANRIFHELERMVPWEYIGVNVVIGSLASIADGLIMVYLLKKAPFPVARAGRFGGFAMILAAVIYRIIGTASKGTQIWNIVVQNLASSESDPEEKQTNKDINRSLQMFQDLDTVASGMLLLFAIGFAILAGRHFNQESKGKSLRKRVASAVAILAAALLVRNAVKFACALVYSQLGKVASLGVQLMYMAVYGFLSVVIFACIIASAAYRGEKGAESTRYDHVSQTANREPKDDSNHIKAKSGVLMNAYPVSQGYDSYRY